MLVCSLHKAMEEKKSCQTRNTLTSQPFGLLKPGALHQVGDVKSGIPGEGVKLGPIRSEEGQGQGKEDS